MWIRIRIMGGLLDPDLDSEAKNSQKFARKSAENLNLKHIINILFNFGFVVLILWKLVSEKKQKIFYFSCLLYSLDPDPHYNADG